MAYPMKVGPSPEKMAAYQKLFIYATTYGY